MNPTENGILEIVDKLIHGTENDKLIIARNGPGWAQWYMIRRSDCRSRELVASFGNDLMCLALLLDPCKHVRTAAQERIDELNAASAQSGAAN